MGAYSGIITLAVGFWFHNSAIKFNQTVGDADKKNAWICFWLGAGTFFGGTMLGLMFNYVLVELIQGGQAVGIGDSYGEASGGDTGAQGIFLEFVPLIVGLLLSYCIREWWVVKKQWELPEVLSKLLKKK